jgi:hypothetical protein
MDALLVEVAGAALVVGGLGGVVVVAAVEFYCQFLFDAEEVEDIGRVRILAAEFEVGELAGA